MTLTDAYRTLQLVVPGLRHFGSSLSQNRSTSNAFATADAHVGAGNLDPSNLIYSEPERSPMMRKTVGAEPAFADFTPFPGLSLELIRSHVNAQIEQFGAPYDVTSCLVDLGDTAEGVATRALQSKRFECIVIGAGLRQPPAQLLVFEKIVNLVHRHAPQCRICFNTSPADIAEAVQRWIRP